jgi:hypothetical protein
MRSLLVLFILFVLGYYIVKALYKLGSVFFTSGSGNRNAYRKSKSAEGEISIDKSGEKEKVFSKDTGEYIDYEEIK